MLPQNISLFKTLICKWHTNSKNKRNFVRICRKTSLNINRNSGFKFLGKGNLVINKSWTKKNPFHSLLSMGYGASIVVNNNFDIYSGAKIYINNNGVLKLGGGYINNNLNLSCFESIDIGNGVVISENFTIRDSDNHCVIGSNKPITAPIKIGEHVWIGMNVTILKGVTIGNGAIIGAGAVVTSNIPERCLACGVPAKVIKQNVDWK